jgi:glycosyltransferase involved in cell wall biosynthesis
VVCFDTSGLKDIVKDAQTGFLAAPHNSESLANKIRAVLEMSNHERESMGKAGREHVIQHFGYEKVATKYAEIVNQAKKSKKTV